MDAIDTREVARRTGLTSRSLRFYETKGLVRPTRSYNGARLYGAAELERLARVVALKGAGLTLAQIARVLAGRTPDLAALVDAQITALSARASELDAALARLRAVRAALAGGAAPDAETLCDIISQGGKTMTNEDWKEVADRYYTPEEQAAWEARKRDLMPEGFESDDYNRKWADLGTRIAADLPMDPAGEKARAYLAEWTALLGPFMAVADTPMLKGAINLWDRIDEWSGGMQTPFTAQVWTFMKETGAAQRATTGSGPL